MDIIGRNAEQSALLECYESGRPEFVAVYGRRRVGKTYLIKETFRDRFDFYATGILGGKTARQLETFTGAVSEAGRKNLPAAKDWFAAFAYLKQHLSGLLEHKRGKRILVFLDELPWFDAQKSEFVSALDHFWNSFASSQPEIMLIACGSAASWMVKNLLNNTGGLHNRVTRRIVLNPFSLAECKRFFEQKGVVMSPYQIIETYMVFGGVPFYLNLISKRKSPAQNINDLCFGTDGELTGEFEVLYASLFRKAERHVSAVRALATKNKGLTRDEIAKLAKLPKGGTLSGVLKELELSGFIRVYRPFGKKARGALYQLADPFTLFHFNFMEGGKTNDESFWIHALESGGHHAWSGYAFEQVCQWHVREIKAALGISGMIADVAGWRSEKSGPAAQIDLVIDRSDGVINLCELKYANGEYTVTKEYDSKLRNKRDAFLRETKTKKALHTTFVTVYGLFRNVYAANIQSEVTADALFK